MLSGGVKTSYDRFWGSFSPQSSSGVSAQIKDDVSNDLLLDFGKTPQDAESCSKFPDILKITLKKQDVISGSRNDVLFCCYIACRLPARRFSKMRDKLTDRLQSRYGAVSNPLCSFDLFPLVTKWAVAAIGIGCWYRIHPQQAQTVQNH